MLGIHLVLVTYICFLQEQYEAGNKDIIALDFTRGGEKYKADMGGKIKNCWCVRFKL